MEVGISTCSEVSQNSTFWRCLINIKRETVITYGTDSFIKSICDGVRETDTDIARCLI